MARALAFMLLATLVSSCGANQSSPRASTPGPSSAAASDAAASAGAAPLWRDATVAHPAAVDAFASRPPGYFCDPCRNLEEDNLFGVSALSAGGFIAVGAVTPPSSAIALQSSDGVHWAPLPGFAAADGSGAVAVAEAGATTVIVGHDRTGAAAWARRGDAVWQPAPPQASLHVANAAGGMTSAVAFEGGFVAAGYRDDPLHLAASGAAWRSTDGRTWTLDDDRGVFAGGRILGLAVVGATLVAVGTAGEQTTGPAAAWRWTAADGWRRATVPAGGGAMRAVAVTGNGLVAVGVNGQDAGAAAWTSPDGRAWTAVPDQSAFHYYQLPVRLQGLVAVGGGVVAGGWRSDQGNGSSVAVTSADGRTWAADPWQPSFSGAEIDALAMSGGTLVAAGRTGYPDNDTAAVWVRAAP